MNLFNSYDEWNYMPGAGYFFADVTQLIESATEELLPGQLLHTEHFTLTESMSAIEIMDPRLDTALAVPLDDEPAFKFDQFELLSAEEVCWVMDHSLAAEMTWHRGHALSQTIHTFLYMHVLPDLDPIEWYRQKPDLSGPNELAPLITSVLSSWTLGLVKTCDLTWREFSKRHVYENEDVITEKSEVSLYEGTPVARVIDALSHAQSWLRSHADMPWSEDLTLRLELRKLLVQIISHPPHSDNELWLSHLTLLQDTIAHITSRPSPSDPPIPSAARSSFDPAVIRRLVSVIPLPVIRQMNQGETWEALRKTVDGLVELHRLEKLQNLLAWEMTLTLASQTHPTFERSAYIRSRTTSTFTNGGPLIFQKHANHWLVKELLRSLCGVPLDIFTDIYSSQDQTMLRYWNEFEAQTSDAIHRHFVALSQNRPRQRRTLANNLAIWQESMNLSLQLPARIASYSPAEPYISALQLLPYFYYLQSITEIIFSGFEHSVDLYAPEERSYLYWFLGSRVLNAMARVIDALRDLDTVSKTGPPTSNEDEIAGVENETEAVLYLDIRAALNSAMRTMCIATTMARSRPRESVTPESFLPPRTRIILKRRFKWASHPSSTPSPVANLERTASLEQRFLPLGLHSIAEEDIREEEDGETIAKPPSQSRIMDTVPDFTPEINFSAFEEDMRTYSSQDDLASTKVQGDLWKEAHRALMPLVTTQYPALSISPERWEDFIKSLVKTCELRLEALGMHVDNALVGRNLGVENETNDSEHRVEPHVWFPLS